MVKVCLCLSELRLTSATTLGVNIEKIPAGSTLDDLFYMLNLDSLEQEELTLAAEEKFGTKDGDPCVLRALCESCEGIRKLRVIFIFEGILRTPF